MKNKKILHKKERIVIADRIDAFFGYAVAKMKNINTKAEAESILVNLIESIGYELHIEDTDILIDAYMDIEN